MVRLKTAWTSVLATRNLKIHNLATTFRRPRQRLLWTIVVCQLFGMLDGTSDWVGQAQATANATVENTSEVFSPQWVEEYAGDKLGCEQGRGHYTWRLAGFGSNINNLLNAWVYALVVEGWTDLAVEVNKNQLSRIHCSQESGGQVSHGWSCLFGSMPHLCTFDSAKMWKRHMTLGGVSARDQHEADRLSLAAIRAADISKKFEVFNMDHRGAKAVMANLLWSYMTPWLRRDIHAVTHVRETFENAPFIAIHVRRGDKIQGRDFRFRHNLENYLVEAVSYLAQEPNGTKASDIKGIWVASDDVAVVDKVRSLAGAYFPSVRNEDIVFVDGGVPGGPKQSKVTTHSDIQGYGSFVYLLADFEQLAAADVFVGTCSSNVGRLVMLLRDGLGKDESSGISLDLPWSPNRHRRLAPY